MIMVLRRLVGAVLALIVLSVVVFIATSVLPGDAASIVAGPTATAEQRARVAADLGLDKPVVTRYLEWAAGAVQGDLGTSYLGRRPVADAIADRLPASLLLAGLAFVVLVPVALILGTYAGMRSERVVSTASLMLVAVPEFLLAALLVIVFAGWLGWLPAVSLVPIGRSPLSSPSVLVLPVLSLALAGAAACSRIVRPAVAEAMRTPHVEAARLAGIRGIRLVFRHVLPGTLGPVLQMIFAGFGVLAGGAVVVETVFGYPGIGVELQRAVVTRDLPMVQGIAVVLGAASLIALLLGDLVTRRSR